MKTRNLRPLLLTLALLLLILNTSCGDKVVVTDYSVIPEPTYLVQKGRSFNLSLSTKLYFERLAQNTPTAKYITSTMRQMHIRPAFTGSDEKNCITITLNDTINPELGNEGYLLQVTPDGIYLSANTEAGLFYAFQTLLQMLPEDIHSNPFRSITLPECTILDHPRFAWRGCCIDVCRHFFTVNQLKRQIDLMAMYKLNKLHLHLSDDQGWRIEIEKYPQLNDIGSWRVDRTSKPWGTAEPARPGEAPTYGGYYTKREIAELVEYAAQRNIEIIPEIELPSHCSAILAAYPDLSCDGGPYSVAIGPYWPHKAILCAGNDNTLTFINDIFDELAQMFPSEYVHIGFDDIYNDNWTHCPKCQQRIHRQGLRDVSQLQNWFLCQIEQSLTERGKRLIGWDDLVDCNSLSTSAAIMASRGESTIRQGSIRGNGIICAPDEYCDLACYQADSLYHPLASPQMLTLLKAYQYDPMPHNFTPDLEHHIWGGEAILWSQYTATYEQAEYQLLPRLCALAESFWSSPEQKEWHHFQQKMVHHQARLAALGYHACPGSFRPMVEVTDEGNGILVTLTTEVPNTYIYYTTDGTDPTPESPVYRTPLHLTHGTLLRTLSLHNGNIQEGIYDYPL